MKRRSLLFLMLVPAVPAFAQNLGLAERRALAAFQTERWPSILTAIHRAAGFEVTVDVRWEQLAIPGQADRYMRAEYFGHTIFDPLIAALTDITRDAMGRDALRTKLNRIVIRLDPQTAPISNYPNGLSFENGELNINWTPGVNTQDQRERTQALVTLLERNL